LRPFPGGPVGEKPDNDLDRAAAEETKLPFLKDFLFFLMRNKKWWLIPILIILLLLSMILLLTTTAAAPFIYSLF
jgi:hypothetical protein